MSGTSGKSEKFESDGNFTTCYGGICAGTGLEYNIGNKLLIFADFTSNMSLTDIGSIWDNPKLKMFDYNISGGIGYRFGSFSSKELIRKMGESNSQK